MHPQTPRLHEWLAAEKDASEAERLLHGEMLKSASGGPGPTADLVLAARAKRAKAYSLFDEAMQETRTLADSFGYRRIETRQVGSGAEKDQMH